MIKLSYRSGYMAGTLTHAYFVLDLYDRLSIRSKELLMYEKENFKLFSLSTDILYYYSKKDKKMKEFSIYVKNNKVYEYFETLINYIKYNNHQYNSQVIAYLYAMLSHYILDSTINPYIIYKTGKYDKNNPDTYKYNMLHEEVELYLDSYLTTIKTGYKPYEFKCYDFCFNHSKIDNKLIEVMDFTYNEVFGIKDFHNYYFKAVEDIRNYYKKYRYDPIGIKKKYYKYYDKTHDKKVLRKVPLSYYVKKYKKHEIFNLDHDTWYNPVDNRIKSNYSILDLYMDALYKCSNIIKKINDYLYYDKKINLKRIIGNLSYETGIDCKKNKELKYLKF